MSLGALFERRVLDDDDFAALQMAAGDPDNRIPRFELFSRFDRNGLDIKAGPRRLRGSHPLIGLSATVLSFFFCTFPEEMRELIVHIQIFTRTNGFADADAGGKNCSYKFLGFGHKAGSLVAGLASTQLPALRGAARAHFARVRINAHLDVPRSGRRTARKRTPRSGKRTPTGPVPHRRPVTLRCGCGQIPPRQ